MSLILVLVLASLTVQPLKGWAQPQDAVDTAPRVLSFQYADGRTVRHVVTGRTHSSWTPMFPRSGNWRSPEGLGVTALSYKYRVEPTGVRVAVAVVLGQPHQKELPVSTVVVGPDQPVRVDELRKFGVAPVSLSIGPFEPSLLYQPQVENNTSALQVEHVEVIDRPEPGYRVTLRNYTSLPVMTFHVETFDGIERHLAVRQGHRDGTPALDAGGTFTFRLNTDRTCDLIRITGLMFEDGRIEGAPDGVMLARVIYAGRRRQLQRVLELVGPISRVPVADPNAAIISISSQIESLTVLPDAIARQSAVALLPRNGPFTSVAAIDGAFAAGLRDVRDGVLRDFKSSPRSSDEFKKWLEEITSLYTKRYLRFIELTAR